MSPAAGFGYVVAGLVVALLPAGSDRWGRRATASRVGLMAMGERWSAPRASVLAQLGSRFRRRRLLPPAWSVAVVAVGGAIGTAARYGLGQRYPVEQATFPATTLVENVVGAALLGCLLTWMVERGTPSLWARPLLATGVLGSFTTFSAFASETVLLVRDDRLVVAVAYVVATTALGIAAAAAGIAAARYSTRTRGAHP